MQYLHIWRLSSCFFREVEPILTASMPLKDMLQPAYNRESVSTCQLHHQSNMFYFVPISRAISLANHSTSFSSACCPVWATSVSNGPVFHGFERSQMAVTEFKSIHNMLPAYLADHHSEHWLNTSMFHRPISTVSSTHHDVATEAVNH